RERAHEDRAWVDAILAGSGTILADDPALTARREGMLVAHQPVRVVLDASGRVPAAAQVLVGPGRVIVATTTAAPQEWRASLRAAGATLRDCGAADEGLNLQQLARALGARSILSMIVEGGASTLASFFEEDLVD